MCIGTLSLFAQIKVSGTVNDANGGTLPGVNVMVKGTTTGVVTDADGAYTITVPDAEAELQFSFVGYTTQEFTVGNRTNIEVTLNEDATTFEEVVVIGYGSLERKLLTNSVSSISAKELPQGVGGATIVNSMKGKISSLTIQETPSPNSETKLQMRGMASYKSSQGPLVVIDGMPGGDIRSVAQEDIQSIDILKDASAGAIYGTRATGGVILITTKQAQAGKAKVTYTGELLLRKNFGKPRILTASEFKQYKPTANDYGSEVDWWDEGTLNPASQHHFLSVQGGTEAARVYASVMYDDDRGVLMGDYRKDFGGRVNASFKTLDGWLNINTHIDYRQANRNDSKPDVGALVTNNPTHDPNNLAQWNPLAGGLGEANVIQDAKVSTKKGVDTWFRPDVELVANIKPVKGLSYHQTFAYEHRQWEWQNYQPSNSTQNEYNNRSGQGTAELKFEKTDLFNSDGYFSYVNQFGDHYLNASAGYSYFERNFEKFRVKNYGFAVDAVGVWDIGSGTNHNNAAASLKSEIGSHKDISQKLLAYFFRANYAFKDKYMASATIRSEGSSKFAENNKWGLFYGFSAGWRMSQESFLQDVEWISELKPRIAYGVTGNEGFDADYASVMYKPNEQVLLPSGEWVKSYEVSKNINPDLRWEEKHEWNFGVDYSFFDNRLYGKIDYYRRNVEGLIYEVNVPSPPYTQGTMYKNIGTLENKGWEFEVGGDIVRNKDWNYSTKLILSHNITKMGDMEDESTYYDGTGIGRAGDTHRIQKNTEVGSWFVYKYAGVNNDGLFQTYNRDGNIITPETDGLFKEDYQYIGSYIPKLTAGWTHYLTYKNWSFGMTLTSWIKFDIYNGFEHEYGTVNGTAGSSSNMLLDAYTKNAEIKGQPFASDYFLYDGTFLKIQNLTLGYQFNTKEYLKVMDSARIYFTANNLYTFTKYPGLNPEVDITGWEGGMERSNIYPQTRTFTFGLQLTF
jgi:TonB-linked SusC/RagA family outer membrane protein